MIHSGKGRKGKITNKSRSKHSGMGCHGHCPCRVAKPGPKSLSKGKCSNKVYRICYALRASTVEHELNCDVSLDYYM